MAAAQSISAGFKSQAPLANLADIERSQSARWKELRCVGFRGPVKERDMRKFCDAIYGDKHVLSATGDLHFGAVDVNEAQRRFFKLSVTSWHVRCGPSADSVTLQASMQGATAELGRRLQKLPHEIVQRQMHLLAQRNY